MAQLMPLPLIVSCSSKIQIGFTFLVPAYPGCPGKEAVKWLFKVMQSVMFVPRLFPLHLLKQLKFDFDFYASAVVS